MRTLFLQEIIKRGIIAPSLVVSYSHTDEDINYTLKAYEEVLPILKKAVENKNVLSLIKGEPVQPVFRKTDNFNMKPVKK